MPPPREDEQSIKARGRQLYQDGRPPEEEPAPALEGRRRRKPFAAYLAEAPAMRLPLATRAILFGAGVVVVGLLGASVSSTVLRTDGGEGGSGAGAVAPPAKLVGTVIGTPGSHNHGGSVKEKVFDGDLGTFFDAPSGDGAWVGLDLGRPKRIARIRYAPRATLEGRMVGGKFQGSSSPDFSAGVADVFTISAVPPAGTLTDQTIVGPEPFRYVRYLAPNAGYGNVSEVEFWGTAP